MISVISDGCEIIVYWFFFYVLVTYPLLGISASVKGGATPKTVNYDIDVTYDQTQVKSKLDAKAGGKHSSDYSVDFEVNTPM